MKFLASLLALAGITLAARKSKNTGLTLPSPDFADCECNCCAANVQKIDYHCDMEIIIAVTGAACVKDQMGSIKLRVEQIINKLYTDSEHIHRKKKVSIQMYSEKVTKEIELTDAIFSASSDEQQALLIQKSKSLTFDLKGDVLSAALEQANADFRKSIDKFNATNKNKNIKDKTRRVLMIVANGGVADGVSEAAEKLRANKVEILVNTITEYCEVPKDCLMCCPHMRFFEENLTTRAKICANIPRMVQYGREQKIVKDYEGADAPYYFNACFEHMEYICQKFSDDIDECNKSCTCECKHNRPGPPGVPGLPGEPGYDGVPGYEGPIGVPGKSGKPGMPGIPGSNGQPGKPCVDGLDAPNGRQGVHGEPGPDGMIGLDGEPGLDGSDGLVGPPGEPGSVGEQGERGPQGRPGPEGPAGPAGLKGLPGPQGCIGVDGDEGPMGLPGPQGDVGLPGEPGDKGYPGRDGKNGIPGLAGEKGEQGARGLPGIKGVSGIDGRQGPPGPKGDAGRRGLKGKSIRFDYSKWQSVVDQEIEKYLASFGWKFNCDCHEDDPRCQSKFD